MAGSLIASDVKGMWPSKRQKEALEEIKKYAKSHLQKAAMDKWVAKYEAAEQGEEPDEYVSEEEPDDDSNKWKNKLLRQCGF